MWGVTLFDEANLNTERRMFRVARRRLERKKQRIRLLEELFAEEIAKTDSRFYIRMKESALYADDKAEEGNIFGSDGYTHSPVRPVLRSPSAILIVVLALVVHGVKSVLAVVLHHSEGRLCQHGAACRGEHHGQGSEKGYNNM